jgi:acetyltransferase-like isoleucine patch superfamily enzyme
MSVRDIIKARRVAYWLRDCESVGDDPRLDRQPSVYAAPGRIQIGHRVRLSSRPVASHFVAGPDGSLEIGDDVSIAHGAAIAAYESVRIGSGTWIGPFSIIMDTNFHRPSGGRSVQHDCRPVSIGSNCRIGSRVTITRGASVGDGAEILAGSVVSSAIPANACAGGARALVLGRAGQASARWDGAYSVLPELVRFVLGLGSAPDFDAPLSSLPSLRHVEYASSLVAAIEARFDVKLDPSVVLNAERLTDVASAIAKAQGEPPVEALEL